MPKNKFGRYVWLIDLLRRRPLLTYEEISRAWADSGYGDSVDEELPWRTFMNHKKAIAEIFDIEIAHKIDHGYRYYIDDYGGELSGDSFKTWLIDSYATLNQVQADRSLAGRISFEQIPSGQHLLQEMIQAMRMNRVVEIEHQGFDRETSSTFEIEPYHLKVVNRRWYVIARSPYLSERNRELNKKDKGTRPEDVILTYGLDRIHRITFTEKEFRVPAGFSIDEYFEGCVGIITDKDECAIERIVVKAYSPANMYLESLPIHCSQRVIERDEESTTFEMHVRPTYNFLTELLQQADQIEIISPPHVRQWMHNIGTSIAEKNR